MEYYHKHSWAITNLPDHINGIHVNNYQHQGIPPLPDHITAINADILLEHSAFLNSKSFRCVVAKDSPYYKSYNAIDDTYIYHYDQIRTRIQIFEAELLSKIFHPKNTSKFSDWGF